MIFYAILQNLFLIKNFFVCVQVTLLFSFKLLVFSVALSERHESNLFSSGNKKELQRKSFLLRGDRKVASG